jgi:hypothetical protein
MYRDSRLPILPPIERPQRMIPAFSASGYAIV